MKALADKKECHPGPGPRSDVVLETKVLVSRRLQDKNTSLGLGLDKKSWAFSSLFRRCWWLKNHDI